MDRANGTECPEFSLDQWITYRRKTIGGTPAPHILSMRVILI
jgi:predicted phage-related endonuclease